MITTYAVVSNILNPRNSYDYVCAYISKFSYYEEFVENVASTSY